MKLRCTTNSIRLRLRRSEVRQLLDHGQIDDFITFAPGDQFCFSIHLDQQTEHMRSSRENGRIRLTIPWNLGRQWANSDMVGISAEQPIGDGQVLQLLVEKDFPCMTRPDEDKTDFFGDLQSKEPTVC